MEENKPNKFKDFAKQDFNLQNVLALLPKKDKKDKKSKKSKEGDGDTYLPEIGDQVDESSGVTSKVANFSPVVPEVNLLPQRVIDEASAARTSKKYMRATIVIGAAFSILFASGAVGEMAADRRADTITTEATNLSVQAGALTPYYQYGKAVEQKRSDLFAKTQGETNYPQIVRDFDDLVRSAGMSTSAVSFSGGVAAAPEATGVGGVQPSGGAACPNPDPFSTETGAGCISFTITGSKDRLLNLYQAADSNPSFLNLNIEQSLFTGGGEEEGQDDGITGTIQYTDQYTTNNNFELNEPLPGAQAATPEQGQVQE